MFGVGAERLEVCSQTVCGIFLTFMYGSNVILIVFLVLELCEVLLFGNTQVPPDSIKQQQNRKEAEEFLEYWKNRIKLTEEAASKAYAESVKEQEEYERAMEGLGGDETDITTKGSGLSIDPLKIVLHPLQLQLAVAVKYVRYVKYIFSWQECYLSFWIAIGCFLLSIICSFIPWFFLIRWSCRILVWTVFGPWMKLVDVYYVSKLKPLTPEEEAKQKRIRREKLLLVNKAAVDAARTKREDSLKLKAMKKHLFGKFIMGVPVLKEDRFLEFPLPESSAVPYKAEQRPLSELAMRDAGYHKVRIPGQHLVGDMIPKVRDSLYYFTTIAGTRSNSFLFVQVETLGLTDAPIGQATSQPRLIDREGPGGVILSGKESTVAAYVKIGTLVVVASFVTWFGVPLLAALTERALKLILHLSR
jgi:hypothetical protein